MTPLALEKLRHHKQTTHSAVTLGPKSMERPSGCGETWVLQGVGIH
jgi:hypothetical protein